MNELIKIGNQEITAKEFRTQRVVTLADIDAVHERPSGTAGRNFRENKGKFIEGEDYHLITGEDLKTLKQATNFVGSNAREIMLITEQGYLMLVKSFTDDLAWKVQRDLVSTYFKKKEDLKPKCIEDVLIESLQEMKAVKEQLEKQDKEITAVNNRVESIREVVALDTTSWRDETANILKKIGYSLGGGQTYSQVRTESYDLLSKRMGVNLKQRLTNKRRRMADEGVSKSKRDGQSYVDIIAEDKKLIEGYTAIVKEMAIKYGVA